MRRGHIMKVITTILSLGLCVFLLSPIKIVLADNHSIPFVPTVTLLVKKYYDMENILQAALMQKDTKKIDSLLAPDFEERKANNPNSPVPRKDWIALKLKHKDENNHVIRQMAVRELGNNYIVSYLSVTSNNDSSMFIVDVWKKSANSNVLMARYSFK